MFPANITRDEAATRSQQLDVTSYEVLVDLSGRRPDGSPLADAAGTFVSTTTVRFSSVACATHANLIAQAVLACRLDGQDVAAEAFDGDPKMTFHLSPPILSRPGPDGRPAKKAYGEGMLRTFGLLARLKALRGTWFDPFGRTDERRAERALIRQYEADMAAVLPALTPATRDAVIALAELPLQIKGFGPVKLANLGKAEKRREELLAVIRSGGVAAQAAAE